MEANDISLNSTRTLGETFRKAKHYSIETTYNLVPKTRKGILPFRQFDVKQHLNENHQENAFGCFKQEDLQSPKSIFKFIGKNNKQLMNHLPKVDPKEVGNHSNSYPYCSVGLVVSHRTCGVNKLQAIGTGFLVGPNIVFTCAHNIYYNSYQQYHQNISFIPSPIVSAVPSQQYFGKGFKVKYSFISKEYREMDPREKDEYNQGHMYDIAILILETETNLQEYFGSFSYDFSWQESQQYQQIMKKDRIFKDITMIGYPRKAYQSRLLQFNCSVISDEHFMIYNLETLRGASGSPLLIRGSSKDEPYQVIAIHQRDLSNIITQTPDQSPKGGLKLRDYQLAALEVKAVQQEYWLKDKNIEAEDMLGLLTQIENHQREIIRNIELQNKIPLLKLILRNNMIMNEGCLFLAEANLPHLYELSLYCNHIGDEGCLNLSKGKWPRLQLLNLRSNMITLQGCKHLAKASHWYRLDKLTLIQNNIQDVEQAKIIFKGKSWNVIFRSQ